MNALALAGQTLTAMGKGPAKEKADRSEWVVRGRTRNIFQRGKMQEADTACWTFEVFAMPFSFSRELSDFGPAHGGPETPYFPASLVARCGLSQFRM